MNLLISPDTYVHYFSKLSNPNKTEIDIDIQALVSNRNNKHIVSKSLIEAVESRYSKDEVTQLIGPYLVEIMDKYSVNIKSNMSENFENILSSTTENNIKLPNPYNISAAISMTEISIKSKCTVIIIPKIQKPGFNWLVFKLACYNPISITLRYSDFTNNNQIKDIFDGIPALEHLNEQPNIFDRQNNLNHHYFDSIKSRVIHYYTARGRNSIESNSKCNEIISHLRRARTYLAPTTQIHERKLIIGSYIIESDDDFQNLEITRTTWKVDFTYCKQTANDLVATKRTNFTRLIPQ